MKAMIRALGILACIVLVACVERPEDHFISFTGCDCQRAHWGRELRASMCNYGPEIGPRRACIYERGRPVTGPRDSEEYPL